jgi:hypothetical protein
MQDTSSIIRSRVASRRNVAAPTQGSNLTEGGEHRVETDRHRAARVNGQVMNDAVLNESGLLEMSDGDQAWVYTQKLGNAVRIAHQSAQKFDAGADHRAGSMLRGSISSIRAICNDLEKIVGKPGSKR